MENKKWIKEIDIIRAVSIILIVISHLHYFLNLGNLQPLLLVISDYIATFGLSLFFFISGFSLYYNYPSLNSLTAVKKFYRKRALRIYPLYIFAVILFFIWSLYYSGNINIDGSISYSYILINILALQGILITTNLGVLFWFIGVLLVYYLIYPLIIKTRTIINFVLFSLFVFGIMYLLHLNLDIINVNFFNYYATFILGIIICWIDYTIYEIYSKDTVYQLILLLPITVLLFASLNMRFISLKFIIISLFICTISYYLIKILKNKFDKIYNIISKISISSYPVFLLHTTILSILYAIFIKLVNNTYYINILIILALPFIFYLCYYIQIYESKLIKSYKNPNLNIKKSIVKNGGNK